MTNKKFLFISLLLIIQSSFCMDVAPEPTKPPEDNEDLLVIQKEEDVGRFAELYVAESEPMILHMIGHPDRYPNELEQGDFTSYGKIEWDTDYKPSNKPPYEMRLFYHPLAVSWGVGDRRRYTKSADHSYIMHLPKTVRLLKLHEVRALEMLFKNDSLNYEWHGHSLSLKDLMPSERRLYRKGMYEKLVPTVTLLLTAAKDPESWLHTLPDKPRKLIGRYLVDAQCRQELIPKIECANHGEIFMPGAGGECVIQ